MAISSLVWFVIIQGFLLTAGSFVFVFIMFNNYRKKKTMGTALLALVYVFLALRQLAGSIFNTLAATNPLSVEHGIFLVVFLATFVLIYYFLYLFGSRHILQDNDVVRGLISVFYLTFTTTILSFIGYEIVVGVENPVFIEIVTEPGTNLIQYMPTTLISVLLYGLILVVVQIRYIINLTVSLVKQKAIDPMRRIGTKYILAAVATLFLDVLLTVVFTIEGLSAAVIVLVYIARFILTILSLLLSYIGWILPNWFRKRVRKKAWIAKKLERVKKRTAMYQTSTTYYSEQE